MMNTTPRARRSAALFAILLGLVGPSSTHAQGQPSTPTTAGPAPTGPQLTKAPELSKFVEAPYPNVEPKPTGDVAVMLQILIDPTGKVPDAKVVESGGPAFDEAALAAVKAFEFSPAEIDGKVSAIRIVYRYVFTIREEKVVPTTSVLTGTVKNAEGKQPLAGVKVELRAGASTVTDEQGHFRFEGLTPGATPITLSGERLTPLQVQENLVAGEELDVSYVVALQSDEQEGPSDDLEILVTAPPALKRETVSTKVSAQEARSIPGAQGDVVRVVESLPGVARSAVGSGQLVVWGAAPGDTRTYVDGVPIPRLYHEGGLRSTVHSAVVKSVELVPGGYGAAYGRGLGGIVRIETETPDKQGLHGTVSGDVFDASSALSTSIGKSWDAAVAGRVSVIDLFADEVKSGIGDYVPIPTYRDAQLRVTHKLANGDKVDLVGMLGTDHTSRGVPNPDPALSTRETRDLSFYRLYARYVTENGKGAHTVLTPYVGAGSQDLVSRYGDVSTKLSSDDTLLGLRASHAVRLANWLTVEGGVDAEIAGYTVERRGSIGLPAREGDVRVFGQPPPDSIGYDRFKATFIGIAPYAEADLALFDDRVHIVPGLRADPLFRSVNRRVPQEGDNPAVGLFAQDFVAEPRLALRWAALERLTLNASTGIYHQQPAPQDLSSQFGNPTLPTSRAIHLVAGAAVKATDKLTVELTGFSIYLDDLTMRNSAESPRRAEALVASGEGHNIGVQTLVRRELADHVFGWVAYTIMRSQRKNDKDAPTRLFDYDQTHVLSTVLVWSPWQGFEVGSRFRLSSGFPRTQVVSTYYDARRDRYQPIFGKQNDIRIPMFMQLDLRVSQAFQIASTKLDAYLEVQNVTNRENAEELVYSPDYTTRGKIRSLPILPVAGLQWTF